MRIRTFLLAACMVVVPLLAMFSHHVPTGTRAVVGEFVRDLVGALRPAPAPLVADRGAIAPAGPAGPEPRRTEADSPASAAPAPSVPEVVADPRPQSLDRLRDLGAVAISCLPLEGRRGHVATCRLPVDAAGQLERIFQATGPDAMSAADQLLRDVSDWRHGSAATRRRVIRF